MRVVLFLWVSFRAVIANVVKQDPESYMRLPKAIQSLYASQIRTCYCPPLAGAGSVI